MDSIKENLREFKDQAIEKVQHARDYAVEHSKHTAEVLDQEVHKSPWTFIGIAALVAAVFGFLLGRQGRR
jgi:ElaB/YqjD/DUF883 family membrane-anchored ribosome-binding protein